MAKKDSKKAQDVKLSVITRDPEHAGILATLDRQILGYGSMYEGWIEGNKKFRLVEPIWGKRLKTRKTPVPGVNNAQEDQEIQRNLWFREQDRGKIGYGYFVGYVGDSAELHIDAYNELVSTMLKGERDRTLKIIQRTYDQFLDNCDHVPLHIYAKGVFDELAAAIPENEKTKVMHFPAEPGSVMDLFFRSLKCAGKRRAIDFVIEKIAERAEHVLFRKGENEIYKRFSDLRDKIGSWMDYENTENEMNRLGLKVYGYTMPLKTAKS